jgi:hypothetical protein
MADKKITDLPVLASGALAATDPLAVASLAGSETRQITAKDFTQKAITLIDDASIPSAKVNLSGISAATIANGTVTATKLDTSTIPATGGLAVSSGNLGLVAPTSPIVRNAGTGSLEHAVSGATAGTYTKVTVDAKGHVTAGTTLAAADIPLATSSVVGGISVGSGLTVTGGGVLNHSNSVGAGTTSGITRDAQGHITGAVALVSADLPVASAGVPGAVSPGTGTSVNGAGALSVTAATSSALGGVIVGGDFAVSTGTISLTTQAGLTAGAYPKVTVTTKGIVTAGAALTAGDIPTLDASKITTGSLDIARVASNTVTGAKLANYAITKIGDTQPTADQIGQFFFNPLSRDLFLWDGNVFQPIGISVGEIVFAGTFDASTGSGTGLITSVTAEGTAIGLAIGQALPTAAAGNNRYYLVVSIPGTITSGNAPHVALTPPDILLSNGVSWTEIDVSQTVTAQVASNVSFAPAGNVAATNVQLAIQELDTEKLPITGGTITGNLEIGTAGNLSFEGATANGFETTIAVVDPTADRTITLPNISGTIITTGDTGTVTSTMLLDGTIVNADIDASAAIEGSKIVAATTSVAGTVRLSDSTSTTSSVLAATPTAVKAAYDLAIAAFPSAGGTLTGNVVLDNQVDARFREATANGTNYVGFQAPASIPADVLWTLPSTDGTSAQVLSTNGSGTLSWATAGNGDVTLTGTQTLTNKTLTDPAIIGTILEDVYTITDGAAFEVDPGNGSIQLITLTASRTPKCTNFVAGESVTLMVNDGTAYTITWTDATWGSGGVIWKGGTAPTLATTGYSVIQFWKVSTQVYGASVGDVA